MESLSFGTPAEGSETSSFLASSSKRPATAESGSLAEIMKIQDDTKARSYLSNLLGDLGISGICEKISCFISFFHSWP